MSKLTLLAVGFETALIDSWEDYLPEVSAPRNYKDQNKIATYILDAKQRQSEDASSNPITVRVSKLVGVAFVSGNRVTKTYPSFESLLKDQMDRGGDFLPIIPRGKQLIDTLLLDAVSRGDEVSIAALSCRLQPLFAHNKAPAYLDPLSIIGASGRLEDIMPLLRRLKIECKDYAINTAEWWAHIGLTICGRLRLAEELPRMPWVQ